MLDNFFPMPGTPMSKPRFSVLSNNNEFILKVSENLH